MKTYWIHKKEEFTILMVLRDQKLMSLVIMISHRPMTFLLIFSVRILLTMTMMIFLVAFSEEEKATMVIKLAVAVLEWEDFHLCLAMMIFSKMPLVQDLVQGLAAVWVVEWEEWEVFLNQSVPQPKQCIVFFKHRNGKTVTTKTTTVTK